MLKIGMDALEVMICVATVKKISVNSARRSSWKKTRGVIFLVKGQRSLRHPRAMFSKRISQRSGRAGFIIKKIKKAFGLLAIINFCHSFFWHGKKKKNLLAKEIDLSQRILR